MSSAFIVDDIKSKIAGGSFWDCLRQGAIIAALNHFAHEIIFNRFVVAGIYGAGGENAGDNPALRKMVEAEGGKMFTSLAGENDGEIIEYLLNGYNKGKGIKIFGYSRGGNAAIRITNKLGDMGINVFALVTFDPHSLTGGTFTIKHNNVANLYNYYQQNPRTGGALGWWGSNPYWGSPISTNFSPSGGQINYTGYDYWRGGPVTHLNIISHVNGW